MTAGMTRQMQGGSRGKDRARDKDKDSRSTTPTMRGTGTRRRTNNLHEMTETEVDRDGGLRRRPPDRVTRETGTATEEQWGGGEEGEEEVQAEEEEGRGAMIGIQP